MTATKYQAKHFPFLVKVKPPLCRCRSTRMQMPSTLDAAPLLKHRHILFFIICRVPGPCQALQLRLDRLLRQHLVHFEEGINQGLFGVAPLIRFCCQQLLCLQGNRPAYCGLPSFVFSSKLILQCQAYFVASSLLCSNPAT